MSDAQKTEVYVPGKCWHGVIAGHPRRAEYVIHFDYGSKKRHNLITVQVHILGPTDATDKAAIEATKRWMQNGELPKGWDVYRAYERRTEN